MTSASPTPATVDLFYSYAHADEPLCEELRKHLTALQRSGLIRDWHDRKIDEGSEWALKIHEALERAGIILLLVSADFLASTYINENELPFALKRHTDGGAVVIPVLLRPVEWRDTPFAKLQVLPTGARPVTAWPDRDAAFSDVAGRLRELLYRRLLDDAKELNSPPTPSSSAERVVDSAIPSSVVIDEPTDLVLMVRMKDSAGLRDILRMDKKYAPRPEDVESKNISLNFPRDTSGTRLAATLTLMLEAPGCDPPRETRKIRIPPAGDSDPVVFMLTPRKAGTLKLDLRILSDDVEIGSWRLVTEARRDVGASLSYGVRTMPLASWPGAPPPPHILSLLVGKPIALQPTTPQAKVRPWMLISSTVAAAVLCVVFLVPRMARDKGPPHFDPEKIVTAYEEYRLGSPKDNLPSTDEIRQQLTKAETFEKTDRKDQARSIWQQLLNQTPNDADNPVRPLAEKHLAMIDGISVGHSKN
jgi:hypothetical protein